MDRFDSFDTDFDTALAAGLHTADPEAAALLDAEQHRQQSTLMLIPSENYCSARARAAQATVFGNKYAEGYPGRRYYNGCVNADAVERLAAQRAGDLFHAEHANVQPLSGAQMNMAVYHALLEPGDTVMALDLNQGGHLTHGSPVNFSGQAYRFVPYAVERSTERLDMQRIAAEARAIRPKLIVTGATAYPRLWDFAAWRRIADDAGALLMADMSHIAGLVAAGLHPDPVPHCDVVTTTTQKTLRGPRGGLILCRAQHADAIDRAVFPAIQAGPHVNTMFAKAVAFHEAAGEPFHAIQRRTVQNAAVLAAELAGRGLRLVSGGTDNHLLLMDLRSTGLDGRTAANLLEEAGMVVNKNTIPYDDKPPSVCSGIRLGTPAISTRGMGEAEMRRIAKWMADVLARPGDAESRRRTAGEVAELCSAFPAP